MSRPARLFLVTEIFFGFATGLLSVHLNFFYRSIPLNSMMIGMISLEGSIATMLCALPAGRIANRYGYFPVCQVGGLLQGIGLCLMALVGQAWSAHLGFILYAAGLTCIHTVEFPYLINMTEEGDKSSAYFLLILAFSVSSIGGSLAGQWMLRLAPEGISPYSLSVFISGAGFLLFSLLRMRLPNIVPATHKATLPILRLLAKSHIRGFLSYRLLFGIAIALVASQLNLIYSDVFGFSSAVVAQLYSATTFLTLLALLLLPPLVRRVDAGRVAMGALGLTTLIFALSIFAGPGLFVVLILLRSTLSQVFPVVIESRMLGALPPSEQSGYASLRVLVASLGQGIGASLTGFFLSYTDFRVLMVVGFLMFCGVTGVYLYTCKGQLERLTALSTQPDA